MKTILAIALIFFASLAFSETEVVETASETTETEAGYDPGFHNKCFNGRLLPAYSDGPCQINNDCVQACRSTCGTAGYPTLSSANCNGGATKIIKKGHKYYKVKQHKQCQCCCAAIKRCPIGYHSTPEALVQPGGCYHDAQCVELCKQGCVITGGAPGIVAFCNAEPDPSGYAGGICYCCCQLGMAPGMMAPGMTPATTSPATTAPVATAPVTTAPLTTAPLTTLTTAPVTTLTTAPVTTLTTAPVTTFAWRQALGEHRGRRINNRRH